MDALMLKNVSKAYENFQLKDISFTLPEGTIMGLIGENGAGKHYQLHYGFGKAGQRGDYGSWTANG